MKNLWWARGEVAELPIAHKHKLHLIIFYSQDIAEDVAVRK
jgi:hypothetical protein